MKRSDHHLQLPNERSGIDLAEGKGRRAWFVGGFVSIGLILLYVLLASEHSALLRVVHEGGVVRMEQGIFAPLGWSEHRPTTAFDPVKPDGDIPVRAGLCADLADCEARLFEVVLEQARRELQRPDRMREAMALIAQAARLASPAQREALRSLEDEEQFARGRMRLGEGRGVLMDARQHFFNVRGTDGPTLRRAAAWMDALDALIESLDAADRRISRPDGAAPLRERPKAAPEVRPEGSPEVQDPVEAPEEAPPVSPEPPKKPEDIVPM